MYEWMHDENVIGKIQREKFINKTVEDCEEFIWEAQTDHVNIHRAIVNDDDQYLGTVSLKKVDPERKNAEFAIAVRTSAMGTGTAKYAMDAMLEYGFNVIGLQEIYWCVKPDNARAIRFYEKSGYRQTLPETIWEDCSRENLRWYSITEKRFILLGKLSDESTI